MYKIIKGIIVFLLVLSYSIYSQQNKNILLLNSYHKGYKWSDDITKGIEYVIITSKSNTSLFVEYMGTKHISDENYYNQLAEIYKRKYEKNKIDVIITSDDNAFNFIKKTRKELFPEVPFIFCGVNYYNPSSAPKDKLFSGVNEEADFESTITLSKQLFPKTEKIYFIHDNTTTGKKLNTHVMKIAEKYSSIDFEFLSDYSMNNLIEKINSIEGNSLILYSIFLRDKNNQFFEFDESIRMISQNAKVPIFGAWDFSLGNGIIGGKLASGYYQGKTAAKMALSVLNGTDISSIPVTLKSPNKYLFDYKVLQRFDISLASLPPESEVINKPISFYSQNKELVWLIIAMFVILMLVIAFLSLNLKKKRQINSLMQKLNADLEDNIKERTYEISKVNERLTDELEEREKIEGELLKRNEYIETIINNLPIGLLVKDSSDFSTTYINSKFKDIIGWPEEIIMDSKRFLLKVFPDKKYRRKIIPFLTSQNILRSAEKLSNVIIKREDGTSRHISTINISMPAQQLDITTIVDETEKNIAKKELKKQRDLLQNVLSTIPDCVYWKDVNLKYLGCNESYANLLGIKNVDDIVGSKTSQLITFEKSIILLHKEDKEIIDGSFPLLKNEVKYVASNGKCFYYLSTKVALYDSRGKTVGVLGILSDITDQKETQKSK